MVDRWNIFLVLCFRKRLDAEVYDPSQLTPRIRYQEKNASGYCYRLHSECRFWIVAFSSIVLT